MLNKLLTLTLTFALAALPVLAQKRVTVKPHKTKSGTVVQEHQRTAPNKTQKDNWSTKGKINPNTGKAGTKTAKK